MFDMFHVCFLMFFSNLYLYNTALSVLFCVSKDIINFVSNVFKFSPQRKFCLKLIYKCDTDHHIIEFICSHFVGHSKSTAKVEFKGIYMGTIIL